MYSLYVDAVVLLATYVLSQSSSVELCDVFRYVRYSVYALANITKHTCVTCQGPNYDLSEDDIIVSKNV